MSIRCSYFSCTLLSLVLLFVMTSFAAAFQVIPVPQNPSHPAIPHLAYNDRPILFKAIARDAGCASVYFRWDFDGNGVWDTCLGRTPAIPTGSWYLDDAYRIDGACVLPYVDPAVSEEKLYIATLQVATAVSPDGIPADPVFASYCVLLDATVPGPEAAEQAADDDLAVMRMVAIDDALWYLHEQMTRIGSGTATITGYLGPDSHRSQVTALFLLAMLAHGHYGAYPVGTYDPMGLPVPPEFLEENDWRYAHDPYAEDVIRATNYLLMQMGSYAIPAADEGDDGYPALAGTNDLTGYYVSSHLGDEFGRGGLMLAALAANGLEGTAVQVASPLVSGQLMEFVVQQFVDFAVAAQNDATVDPTLVGGWGWQPCLDCASNSVASHITSFWVLGLETAERKMGPSGVYVNQRLKTRLPNAVYYNQHSDGGPRYYTGATNSIFETVGGAILACRWMQWDSWDTADPTPTGYPHLAITRGEARGIYDDYINYTNSHWNMAGGTGNIYDPTRALWKDGQPVDITPCYDADIWTLSGSLLCKGARYRGVTDPLELIGGHDWRHDFAVSLVEGQHPHSDACPPYLWFDFFHEPGASLVGAYLGDRGATAHAVLMAATENMAPVAVLGASPCHGGECSSDCCVDTQTDVAFAAGAYDSDGLIVEASLDFGDGSPPVEIAPPEDVVYYRYTSAGIFPAVLTATDDEGATRADTLVMEVEEPSEVLPESLPRRYRLYASRPNPFSPRTVIAYELPEAVPVTIEILDITGRAVRTLVDGAREPAGHRQILWDGRDHRGQALPSGVYFCRIHAGPYRETRRLIRSR
ncbi:MAG: PKD domain-containing protein [Candidatus Eisenbacteria sp.]|nr:PKD domain-containing protein [Candidatus Eisenbacteria bacterium]